MTNLTLNPQWHAAINQVENGEFITGGPSGNANRATKQLAENLFWLKDGFDCKKSANGYCKFPNGLIMQWGVLNLDSEPADGLTQTITLPISFPNSCFTAHATRMQNTGTGEADGHINLIRMSKTEIDFSLQHYGTDWHSALRGFTWFALGH